MSVKRLKRRFRSNPPMPIVGHGTAPPVHIAGRGALHHNGIAPLLVSRRNAAIMLGDVSLATLRRMEKDGILIPIRLRPNAPTGEVYYKIENVHAVAGMEATDAK